MRILTLFPDLCELKFADVVDTALFSPSGILITTSPVRATLLDLAINSVPTRDFITLTHSNMPEVISKVALLMCRRFTPVSRIRNDRGIFVLWAGENRNVPRGNLIQSNPRATFESQRALSAIEVFSGNVRPAALRAVTGPAIYRRSSLLSEQMNGLLSDNRWFAMLSTGESTIYTNRTLNP